MSNKQLKEILIAMMFASGLEPELDEDYYQGLDGTSIRNFLEGVTSYFQLQRNASLTHFVSLDYLDSPSETIAFFIKHKEELNK